LTTLLITRWAMPPFIVLAVAFALLPSSGAAADYVELNDFQLIDATGAAARHVDRMIARDGVIVAIDDAGTVPTPEPDAQWTRIGLKGAWVMPGLIDTHVHVARFPDTRARAASILLSAVRGGVTGVRDLTGDVRALADVERAIVAGEMIGPELIYSALYGGPDIFKEGPMAGRVGDRAPGTLPWSRSIDKDSDLRQFVAEGKGTGARNIKVYGDLNAELATRLIAESRRQGLLTTAHATVFPARPGDLVDAGIGSLSHAPYLVWEAVDTVPSDYRKRIAGPWNSIAPDHPKLLALYRRMAARGVTLDATLYVYYAMNHYPGLPKQDWTEAAFAWGAKATKAAREAGVIVTTGTDWFEPRDETELPHTHEELALLVDHAGFTPMQALIAGTRNGAIALGLEATHGSIEVGKFADLLVLDADPLADIHNTQRIRMTLRHGNVIKP
jgi:imidazolonepropionase-like amidohydrolase